MTARAKPKPALRPFLPADAPLLAEIFRASIAELTGGRKQLARVGAGRGTFEDRWRLESGRLIGHSSLLSAPSQVLGGG